MPIITNEQRDAAYEAASESTKQLCSSPESSQRLETIAKKYQLGDMKTAHLVLITGDTVLGLRRRSELPQSLQAEVGVTAQVALQITGDLIDFMEGKEFSAYTQIPLPPKPPATKHRTNPAVRTMAGDMAKLQNDEPVYSTTQETLLSEGRQRQQQ